MRDFFAGLFLLLATLAFICGAGSLVGFGVGAFEGADVLRGLALAMGLWFGAVLSILVSKCMDI